MRSKRHSNHLIFRWGRLESSSVFLRLACSSFACGFAIYNWRDDVRSDDEDKKDADAYKAAFKAFGFS